MSISPNVAGGTAGFVLPANFKFIVCVFVSFNAGICSVIIDSSFNTVVYLIKTICAVVAFVGSIFLNVMLNNSLISAAKTPSLSKVLHSIITSPVLI